MFGRKEPDVLVAGAGPVGLIAALSLTQEGVRTRIIDDGIGPASHSYGLALHPGTLDLLESLGVDPEPDRPGLRIDTMAFYDGSRRRAEVSFSDLPAPHPYALVLRQSWLEQMLTGELRKRKCPVGWLRRLGSWEPEGTRIGVVLEKLDQVSTGYAISDSEWQVSSKHGASVRFLIGADGHRSAVRHGLAIDHVPVGETQLFGVFEFENDWLPRNEVRVVLADGTTNVVWPLPDGRCRWSFQLPPDWEHRTEGDARFKSRIAVQVGKDYFPVLDTLVLDSLLERRAPWFEGKRAPVHMHSMNVGMREAHDLAGRVAAALSGARSMKTLDAYARERAAEWRSLLGLAGDLTVGPGTDEWVAEHAAGIMECLPAGGRDRQHLAAQLGLEVGQGNVMQV